MSRKSPAAIEAIRRSKAALRKGEKDTARRWAEKAASIAPNLEDAWFLLAATSRPQLSIHYLERALAINPQSKRALKGMAWAKKRLAPPPVPKPFPEAVEETSPKKVKMLEKGEITSQKDTRIENLSGGILQIH